MQKATNKRHYDLWLKIEPHITNRRFRSNYVRSLKQSFFHFFEKSGATTFEDMEDVNFTHAFIDFYERNNANETYIVSQLRHLSALINGLSKASDFEHVPFFTRTTKNPFEYILQHRTFRAQSVSHPIREKDEIEIYINSIPDRQKRLAYEFACMALRRFEIFELTKNQVDLEGRALINVIRKGGKKQPKLALPKWIIPDLRTQLEHRQEHQKVFDIDYNYMSSFQKTHFNRLMNMREKLMQDPGLSEKYQSEIHALTELKTNGLIKFHSLRATWDTVATKLQMQPEFRYYHMNHAQGMDAVYVQINKKDQGIWDEYIYQLDNKSIQYNFGGP